MKKWLVLPGLILVALMAFPSLGFAETKKDSKPVVETDVASECEDGDEGQVIAPEPVPRRPAGITVTYNGTAPRELPEVDEAGQSVAVVGYQPRPDARSNRTLWHPEELSASLSWSYPTVCTVGDPNSPYTLPALSDEDCRLIAAAMGLDDGVLCTPAEDLVRYRTRVIVARNQVAAWWRHYSDSAVHGRPNYEVPPRCNVGDPTITRSD